MDDYTLSCVKGDDAPCVDKYEGETGVGACCYMATVASATEKKTDAQKGVERAWAALGWPTVDGESNTFCLSKTQIATYAAFTAEDESAEWKVGASGAMYTGYCTSAVKIAAALSATAATVFATAF